MSEPILAAMEKLERERDVWKHEAEILRAELKKADEAQESNFETFIDLREQLTTERALADRLGMFADVTAHSCPNEQIQRNAQEAITAWKEARK